MATKVLVGQRTIRLRVVGRSLIFPTPELKEAGASLLRHRLAVLKKYDAAEYTTHSTAWAKFRDRKIEFRREEDAYLAMNLLEEIRFTS